MEPVRFELIRFLGLSTRATMYSRPSGLLFQKASGTTHLKKKFQSTTTAQQSETFIFKRPCVSDDPSAARPLIWVRSTFPSPKSRHPKRPKTPKNVRKRPKTLENDRKRAKIHENGRNVRTIEKFDFFFKPPPGQGCGAASSAAAAPRPAPRPRPRAAAVPWPPLRPR